MPPEHFGRFNQKILTKNVFIYIMHTNNTKKVAIIIVKGYTFWNTIKMKVFLTKERGRFNGR